MILFQECVIEIGREILLDKYQITGSNVILSLSFCVGNCFMFVLRDIPEDSLSSTTLNFFLNEAKQLIF